MRSSLSTLHLIAVATSIASLHCGAPKPTASVPSDAQAEAPCQPGENRPATDGCNTCECNDQGKWVCTLMVCAGCQVGQDQTCNDDPSVSALWGRCEAAGQCACSDGFELNPATGRCRPSVSP